MTYCIKIKFQNPYIGSRHGGNSTLYTGLSLKEAYKILLELYNDKYSSDRPYATNWGLAVIQSKPFAFGAVAKFRDKTRSFDWDSICYSIEKEDENNEDN